MELEEPRGTLLRGLVIGGLGAVGLIVGLDLGAPLLELASGLGLIVGAGRSYGGLTGRPALRANVEGLTIRGARVPWRAVGTMFDASAGGAPAIGIEFRRSTALPLTLLTRRVFGRRRELILRVAQPPAAVLAALEALRQAAGQVAPPPPAKVR